MTYVFQEFPKSLYKNGVPAATAHDKAEQKALLKEGYELPPSNEEPPVACEGCEERDAKLADLQAKVKGLEAKLAAATVPKAPAPAPAAAPKAPAAVKA